jgi:alkylation response protein AidB-like acyl-CoA dehydrogenase
MTKHPGDIYTSEHETFRQTVKRFLADELTSHIDSWEESGIPDPDFWRKAGALGIFAPFIKEEFGGAGGDFLHHLICCDELGACAAGASAGIALECGLVAYHIQNFGTDEQKQQWLPKLCRGEAIPSIGMTEPHTGSDLQALRTTAIREGNEYIINGSKTYISGGIITNLHVLAAKTDPALGARGISLFLIDPNTPGFHKGRNLKKMGKKGSDLAELFFDDMRVPASCLLGNEGDGFRIMMSELPKERLGISLRSLSSAELAFDLTVEFVKQRQAFGQKVFDFQNTQFTLAEIKTELTIGRAFINDCIRKVMVGQFSNEGSAMAKLWLTELEWRVMDKCLQLHGGAGYMDEYPISKLFTSARIHRIYGGTSEIMKYSIAKTI